MPTLLHRVLVDVVMRSSASSPARRRGGGASGRPRCATKTWLMVFFGVAFVALQVTLLAFLLELGFKDSLLSIEALEVPSLSAEPAADLRLGGT